MTASKLLLRIRAELALHQNAHVVASIQHRHARGTGYKPTIREYREGRA